MTYVLDLKRLWDDRTPLTASECKAAASVHLDPRQRVVSAIVVIDNDDLRFVQTLHAVLAQLMVRELIVVNTCTSISVAEALTQFSYQHPRTIMVTGSKASGLAGAYNLGAQYASTPYILFLDAYCLLPKDTVLHLLATGVRKPRPWVVGAASVKTQAGFKSKAPIFKNYFSKMTQNNLPEVSLAGGGHYAEIVPSQCILLPAQTFSELKGLDKHCYHAAFHWDLCLRVHEMGGGVFQAPNVVLTVCEPDIDNFKALLMREWQSFRGWRHFYQKNLSRLTNLFAAWVFYVSLTLLGGTAIYRRVMQQWRKSKPLSAMNAAPNEGA